MAKKLSFDIQMNTAGYTAGAKAASRANQDLANSTKSYLQSCGTLNSQLREARLEARNLAVQFSQLSKTERESEIGQQMAEELDFAIEKAAELQDVFSDVNEAIKRGASDTQGWDALKDTFEIGKSAATAYAGALAKVSGDAKSLQQVIGTLAMIEGGFNSVIKVGNALQKQSNIMIALKRAGVISLSQAEAIQTASTKAATIATKALGVAMKALPYVAIAAGVYALGTAIKKYIDSNNSALIAEQKRLKLQNDMHSISIEGQKDAQKELVNLKLLYDQTQNTSLSMNARLAAAKELKSEYPSYLNQLSEEAILAGQASDAYKQMAADIVSVAIAKGYQKKIEEIAQETAELQEQAKAQKKLADQAKATADALNKQPVIFQGAMGTASSTGMSQTIATRNANKAQKELDKTNEKIADNKKAMMAYQGEINKSADAYARLNANNRATTTTTKNNVKLTKEQTTYLEQLENKVKGYQKQLENVNPKSPNAQQLIQSLQASLSQAQQELKDYKLLIGVEVEKPKSFLETLKDELKEAELQLPFNMSEEDTAKAKANIQRLKEAIEKEEIRLGIKVDTKAEKLKADLKSINDIYNEAMTPDSNSKKWNFDYLSDGAKEAAEQAVKEVNKIDDAITKLNKKKSENPALASEVDTLVGSLEKQKAGYEAQAKAAEEETERTKLLIQRKQELATTYENVEQIMGGLSNAFGALGDSEAAQAAQFAANTGAILANAAKTIAAMNAEALANGSASAFALPFPANLAAWATVLTTITSIFASLPKFAEGGVIKGNSFFGDNILARLNSGERVLTAQQNRNFEKLVNNMDNSRFGPQRVIVTGRIAGGDIYLSQKHYKTINHIK